MGNAAADFLLEHLMTEGSSLKLRTAVNVTLGLLIATLLYLSDGVLPAVHLQVMGGLSLVLLVSVNWFIVEFKNEMAKQATEGKLEGEMKAVHSDTSSEKLMKSD